MITLEQHHLADPVGHLHQVFPAPQGRDYVPCMVDVRVRAAARPMGQRRTLTGGAAKTHIQPVIVVHDVSPFHPNISPWRA